MVRKKVVTAAGRGWTDAKRMKALSDVAADFPIWKPARDVLEIVRSVETVFPQVNLATRIGGWPIQRITVVHGPSNMGKTAFVHGLGLSFLLAGHYYAFVDAELTSPIDWVERLMGKWAKSDPFRALRPKTYEQTVDSVRSFVEAIATAREKDRLPSDTSALIGVDSLRKLIPDRIMKKLLASTGKPNNSKRGNPDGGIDGMAGRAAQYKAALNAAWLDELGPLMAYGNTGIVIIGRESERVNAQLYDDDWKLTGGKALEFDSSLTARIERAAWLKHDDRTIGEKIRIRIRKTKVGSKDDKVVDCYMHLSNGVLVPEGFDRARDMLELAKQVGAVVVKGAWYHDAETGEVLGQGENATVVKLTEDSEALAQLESNIEARCVADNERGNP